jgi:hypothetical protein
MWHSQLGHYSSTARKNLLQYNPALFERTDVRGSMKRYLIFVAVGPFLGGLLLLLATTVASEYWTNW